MKELLWKDFRLIRPFVLVMVVGVGILYAIGAVVEIKSAWPQWPTKKDWAELLIAYGTVILVLSCCLTAILGGYAIACERGDRSANFLANLPPGKLRILISKFLVAAAVTALLWGWILFSLYVIAPHMLATANPGTNGDTAETLGQITPTGAAALCVLTFGVGWLASAFMEKTLGPIVAALASPLAVGLGLNLAASLLSLSRVRVSNWAGTTCLALGIGAFLWGSWNYYRRVEP